MKHQFNTIVVAVFFGNMQFLVDLFYSGKFDLKISVKLDNINIEQNSLGKIYLEILSALGIFPKRFAEMLLLILEVNLEDNY